MKALILGHGDHGKDTVAEMLRDMMGLSFESSSLAASEIVVFPALKDKYGYSNPQECFDDRRNHRQEWKQLITDYNTPDKARLCREILERVDCYVGMRCQQEYEAVKDMFGLVVWVDAGFRKPPDPTMAIKPSPDMWLIENNSTIESLYTQIERLSKRLKKCLN